MKKITCVLSLLALFAASSSTCWAQALPAAPVDVDNLRLDTGDPAVGGVAGRRDIPNLRPDIALPDVQFIFDSLLDPEQISALQRVGATSIDDPRLSASARSLIRNHLVAMQQVELAIRFLQASRDDILSGRSQSFNSVFGNISVLRDVAILAPTPITSNATLVLGAANPQGGVTPPQLTFAATNNNNNARGGYVFGDYLANRSIGRQGGSGVGNQLGSGDFIYLTNSTSSVSSTATTGVVQRVFAYIPPPAPGATGGGGGAGAGQERIILDPNQAQITPTQFVRAGNNNNNNQLAVYRILRFEKQTDSTRYEQVLATFRTIRGSLAGVDPTLTATTQFAANPILYNRGFTDINSLWTPGVAAFTDLNSVVARFIANRAPGQPPRLADRLVRQAGFSTSDSHFHIDVLEDQSSGLAQGRLPVQRATLPLLWTEDNDLPLVFESRLRDLTKSDFDRPFFRDRQTIFSEPNNVFTQYLGRAFFEETEMHASNFYDDSVQTNTALLQAIRQARMPAGGARLNSASANNGNIAQLELANIPETGTPKVANTELRKWQMIIESFAEYTTDLTQFNVAAVGLAKTFGRALPGDLTARDAGSYARFADLLGGVGADSIDISRVEPFGKRASAGFNPVVPVN